MIKKFKNILLIIIILIFGNSCFLNSLNSLNSLNLFNLFNSLKSLNIINQFDVEHYCVSNAIRDAWSASKEGYEVRIGHYKTVKPNINHVQVQVKIDGNWEWVTTHYYDGGRLIIWNRHFDYGDEPRFQALEEFIQDQIRFTKNKQTN